MKTILMYAAGLLMIAGVAAMAGSAIENKTAKTECSSSCSDNSCLACCDDDCCFSK